MSDSDSEGRRFRPKCNDGCGQPGHKHKLFDLSSETEANINSTHFEGQRASSTTLRTTQKWLTKKNLLIACGIGGVAVGAVVLINKFRQRQPTEAPVTER